MAGVTYGGIPIHTPSHGTISSGTVDGAVYVIPVGNTCVAEPQDMTGFTWPVMNDPSVVHRGAYRLIADCLQGSDSPKGF